MHKRILSIDLPLILAVSMSMVQADDMGIPKPGTPVDNECFPGGVLYREGNQDGCPTVWYWKAGWYLSQVNQGLLAREDVPDEFNSVLPPVPGSGEEAEATCTITTKVATFFKLPEANTIPLTIINGTVLSWQAFSWDVLNGKWYLSVGHTVGPFWVPVWMDNAWRSDSVVATDCPTPTDPTASQPT